jgi:type I restriction-modification system DNA methylase subunit
MLHQPIFASKEIQNKLRNYSLKNIPLLEEKIKKLEDWQRAIRSGRIAQTNEEALQADFLNTLFGDVLEYEYKDPHEWNLDKESKTLSDSTKSDGALGFFSLVGKKITKDVQVVIELKDARSDLDKAQNRKSDKRTPVEQAFGYASKVGGNCRWVIVSNFIELRLYHHSDQTRYEVFDLTRASEGTELVRLFYFLHKDRLIAGHTESVVDVLYKERQAAEKSITKRFYSDYKEARINLFKHLRDQNPATEELTVFNKTQKLLDRIVFVCFCEDKAIIPPYTFRGLLKSVKENRFDRTEDKIYKSVKGLFTAIDEGYPQAGINKFNGGLFAPDEVLDNLQIKDSTLEHIISLEQYDFDSELNVNILGHIFEQSISDIEELKAQITGEIFDEKKGKRKKDGIFYTPEYITRYIVKEAVGGWLDDRKKEIGFDQLPELLPEDLASVAIKKGGVLSYNKKVEKHLKAWETYREKLTGIKVLDPACGSGAFLNQVFDYLYAEGQRVNAELARLRAGQYEAFDLDKHILTQNIFGVDLNPESVEITKLSLWLKTANKTRELTTLDANIKCGNSLIDDPAVAGERAFAWEKEFAGVMASGGFDVVVGNPPYVRVQNLKHDYIDWLKSNYNTAFKRVDLSLLFFELSREVLLSEKGIVSLITSNQFLVAEYGQNIRQFIVEKFRIREIIDFGDLPIFEDALTYVSIFTFENNEPRNFNYLKVETIDKIKTNDLANLVEIDITNLGSNPWQLKDKEQIDIVSHLRKHPNLGNGIGKCSYGIVTGNDDIFILSKNEAKELGIENECILPLIRAENCSRYGYSDFDNYVIYPYKFINGDTILLDIKEIELNYPKLFQYLIDNKLSLVSRKDSRTTFEGKNNWYTLTRFGQLSVFNKDKIVFPGENKTSKFGIDLNRAGYSGARVFGITVNKLDVSIKYLLCLLNSKIIEFYLHSICALKQGGFYSYSSSVIDTVPIPSIPIESQQPFIEKADLMLSKNNKLQELKNQFLQLLQSELGLQKPNTKLGQWYTLAWPEFGKELEKAKIKLSLSQKSEWMAYFNTQKEKAQAIQSIITQTDQEIDAMVYKLYELTEEEIAIVEGK